MINTIIGTKQEMTARFNARGNRMPITIIQANPNIIIKTDESRATIGAGTKKKVKRTENGYVKAAGFAPRIVKEVKLSKSQSQENKIAKPGDKLTVSIFSPGDIVKVTGITKGRGFAGGVKRWGFAGGPKTHGQSDRHRAPGSIGQTTTPGRVYKGKKMAGHMGANTKTIIGLAVVAVDEANNQLLVKGPIPGSKNSFVIVEKTGTAKDPSNYQLFEATQETEKITESEQEPSTAKDEQKVKDEDATEIVSAETAGSVSKNKSNNQPNVENKEVKESAK